MPVNAAAATALAGAGALVWWQGRSWFFFYDEWGIVLYRRSGGASAFLAPHNGHLQASVFALYRVLFSLVGLRHYGPYRAVQVTLHVAAAAAPFLYGRRRVSPAAAVGAAAAFGVLGAGWEVLYWLGTAGLVLSLLAATAVMLWWDRRPPGRKDRWGPVVTALAVTAALASFGSGLALAAGLLVEALWRRWWPRAAAVAVPVALWCTWWLLYRPTASTPGPLRRLPGALASGDLGRAVAGFPGARHLAGWVARSALAAAGAVGGIHVPVVEALVLALVGGGAVLAAVRPGPGADRVRPRLAALATALAGFWVLTGLARSATAAPGASRYQYFAAFLLVLLLLESAAPAGALAVGAARRWSGHPARAADPFLRPVGAGLAVLVLAATMAANVRTLHRVGAAAGPAFAPERSGLALVEACRGRIPPGYNPDPALLPGFAAGPFLAATRQLGQPVPPAGPDELRRRGGCPG